MSRLRHVIAVAGAGDLGRYVSEEILASPDFELIIITRAPTPTSKWFSNPNLSTCVAATDYTVPSLLHILNTRRATTLLSFLNIADDTYITVHAALLEACTRSTHCKRLIPSEYIGDVEAYPLKPDYYATTRLPFREMLAAQGEVEWTLVMVGWLMDYFLMGGREGEGDVGRGATTYLKPIPGLFPVDCNAWAACVRGTGDERQSWTCAGDVGRALVRLCRVERGGWEQVTWMAGEWSTFNEAISKIEAFYDLPLPRTHKTHSQIQHDLKVHADDEDMTLLEIAQVEEMMVMEYLCVPREKTLTQREKYFAGMRWLGLRDLLGKARDEGVVVR